VDKWGWGKMGKKASNEQDDNVLVLCADLSVDFVFPFYSPFYTSFFVSPLLEKLPRPLQIKFSNSQRPFFCLIFLAFWL